MNFQKLCRWASRLTMGSVVVLALLIVGAAMHDGPSQILYPYNMQAITQVDCSVGTGQKQTLTLPTKLTKLEPRTAITLRAEIEVPPQSYLMVKTAFAPLQVYVNGRLTLSLGQEGSYPAFMADPPTLLGSVALPEEGGAVSIRMEYQSPNQRSEISLPVLYAGEQLAFLNRLLVSDGFSLLFSMLLVFLGILMSLVSITFVHRVPAGNSFLWLGLFSLSAGIWGLGECELSSYLFALPTLLYNMAYLGLFFLTIPFLRFGLLVLQPRQKWPFQLMLGTHYAALLLAVALHLSGAVNFIASLYWFHVIAPLGFVTFAASLLWEHFCYRNPAARRFAVAILWLSVAVLLELLNYWIGITGTFTLFFQVGVLGFVVALGVASGHYIRESIKANTEKELLKQEMQAASQMLALQQRQYEHIAQTDMQVRMQRHDLRHQLMVIQQLAAQKDTEQLSDYLAGLVEAMPTGTDMKLCENFAVNAIAAHYADAAEEAGIKHSIKLQIPADTGVLQDIDLCVVVGNILENAVEACKRMRDGVRYVSMQGRLKAQVLMITCENSFEGELVEHGEVLLSNKREGEGMGMHSVMAVARKYGGIARFEPGEGVFLTSVYVHMSES